MTHRIVCPLCEKPLTYTQLVREYGYLEKQNDGTMEQEWNDTIVITGPDVSCDTTGCTFKLGDFTDLESEIIEHLG